MDAVDAALAAYAGVASLKALIAGLSLPQFLSAFLSEDGGGEAEVRACFLCVCVRCVHVCVCGVCMCVWVFLV